tara:strand:+ start:463 stop:642 length:180 start_codon:yes stop_codon:yes gene_type:complete
MFGIFKKKSEKEKLIILYKKKQEQAYKLSRVNRAKSDQMVKEASEILKKIDIIDKKDKS